MATLISTGMTPMSGKAVRRWYLSRL